MDLVLVLKKIPVNEETSHVQLSGLLPACKACLLLHSSYITLARSNVS